MGVNWEGALRGLGQGMQTSAGILERKYQRDHQDRRDAISYARQMHLQDLADKRADKRADLSHERQKEILQMGWDKQAEITRDERAYKAGLLADELKRAELAKEDAKLDVQDEKFRLRSIIDEQEANNLMSPAEANRQRLLIEGIETTGPLTQMDLLKMQEIESKILKNRAQAEEAMSKAGGKGAKDFSVDQLKLVQEDSSLLNNKEYQKAVSDGDYNEKNRLELDAARKKFPNVAEAQLKEEIQKYNIKAQQVNDNFKLEEISKYAEAIITGTMGMEEKAQYLNKENKALLDKEVKRLEKLYSDRAQYPVPKVSALGEAKVSEEVLSLAKEMFEEERKGGIPFEGHPYKGTYITRAKNKLKQVSGKRTSRGRVIN